MIRVILDRSDAIQVVGERSWGDDAFIFLEYDKDGDCASGSTHRAPEDWENELSIKKELSSEQVKQLFQAIREVFDEM